MCQASALRWTPACGLTPTPRTHALRPPHKNGSQHPGPLYLLALRPDITSFLYDDKARLPTSTLVTNPNNLSAGLRALAAALALVSPSRQKGVRHSLSFYISSRLIMFRGLMTTFVNVALVLWL